MNNLNVFQKRAAERKSDKFSTVSQPVEEVQLPQDVIDNDETPKNIFQKHAELNKRKKEDQFGFLDTLRDIGEQIVSKGISGIGGAYGNILDTFGLQLPEGQNTLPGQKQVYDIQSNILDKINRGETPSFGELSLLSDDDVLPSVSRLPTSKDIQKGIKDYTGVGDGKTATGRIAGHGAQALGEGLVTGAGGKVLGAMGLSNVAGQGIREAGGPETLATATEIVGPLTPSVISKRLIPSAKGAKDLVKAGRQVGLTENQITPLIQGESKSSILSKVARKGTKTKELFSSIKESLGDSYNSIKSSPQARVKLPNAEQIGLRREFGNIRNELSKTLAPSPDKEAALNYIEKSLETLRNTDVTPEYLVNFWQDINKSVKWNSINGGKKALARLKEPVSEALKKVSPQLAEDFEMTNQLYSKYAQISKKLKPDLVDSFVNKGEILTGVPAGLSLLYGNPLPLVGLGGEVATRLLGREMLINPYFQNIAKKLVVNFNQGSVKGVTELVKQVQDYMKRKHPEHEWGFLTNPQD